MKIIILVFFFFTVNLSLKAQSAEAFFDEGAKLYLKDNTDEALSKINKALEIYPDNQKLKSLKTLLEKKEQQKQEQKEKEEQEDSGKEEQKNDAQEEQERKSQQENGQNKGEKGSGSNDEQLNREDNSSRPNASPNSAGIEETNYNNILKALKQQEKNTQRRLLRSKTRALGKRNQKDW